MRNRVRKISVRAAVLLLSIFLCRMIHPAETEAAVSWPSFPEELTAESAVVMDADTGTLLYGKDADSRRFPASITKILTALVVIENCDLSEPVEFSESAVYGLESGAVTTGAQPGDVLSVEDCLYALLLKSANDVANALAEHVSGSVGEFAVLMNRRAAELGCTHSDFRNPSGLTDPEHLTTARDMALIACACMNNPVFMEIESSVSRKIAPISSYPDGFTVTIGHKMRKKNETWYDARVKAGKTGYTTSSGNTLVTMAEDGGRRIVAVVLKDKNPDHYQDTLKLLNYGFTGFRNFRFSPGEILSAEPVASFLAERFGDRADSLNISLTGAVGVTAPEDTDPEELSLRVSAELPENAPENAVLQVSAACGSHPGAEVLLCAEIKEEPVPVTEPAENPADSTSAENGERVSFRDVLPWLLAAAGVLLCGFLLFFSLHRKKQEQLRMEEIHRKRRERLKDSEISEEEFSEKLRAYRNRREQEPETGNPETEVQSPLSGTDTGTEPETGTGSNQEPEMKEAPEFSEETQRNESQEEPDTAFGKETAEDGNVWTESEN